MRRVLDTNRDLVARRKQATPTSEQYSLFRAYIDSRHADGGMADMSVLDYAMMVEDSIIDTFMTEYRLAPEPGQRPAPRQPLVAAALCDRLSDGISMVYSFYDPEAAKRGLGTFMILDHIAHAKRWAALRLPGLLDQRLPQDELQAALPAAGAAHRDGWRRVGLTLIA